MYPVTNDYKIAIAKNARAHRIAGSVDGHYFDGSDVIRDSFVYKNQLCPATAIQLGGVYIGECDLVFSKAFADSLNIRGSWKGKALTIAQSVEAVVDDEPTFISIPIGVFTIENAVWNDRGLSVTAYDNMAKFDKPLLFDQSGGTLYSFLSYICRECGVTLGMTEAQVQALPNGTRNIGIYPGSSMSTFRDCISQLAVVACSYATIDRSGQLVLRRLPDFDDLADTVSEKMRYSTSFSDYTSYYTDLAVTNMDDSTTTIYSNTNIGGLTLDIGENPFLQYGVSETVKEMRQAIIDALTGFRAVPFKVSCLPNPAYDLGDRIKFTGGIGQDSQGVVMSLIMKSTVTTIEGYGENPAAAGAQSSIQKQVAANAKNQKGESLTYYSYINTAAVSLTTTAQRLYRIAFVTADTTNVELWHEVKWNVDTEGGDPVEITYEYYLDGVKFDYEPVDTWTDGYHSMPHPFWLLEVSGGAMHYWEVRAKINGGSATASIGDIHALLKGQKLVGSVKFDGNIEIEETYEPFTLGLDTATFVDAPVISKIAVNPNITASDTFEPFTFGLEVAPLVDTQVLTAQTLQYTRVTEDGNTRVTEEGDVRLTEV